MIPVQATKIFTHQIKIAYQVWNSQNLKTWDAQHTTILSYSWEDFSYKLCYKRFLTWSFVSDFWPDLSWTTEKKDVSAIKVQFKLL